MPTEVQLAVAGSGKTTSIVQRIRDQSPETRSAAITFTLNAQAEITRSLPARLQCSHETMGWFAFLVRHIVRPYLPPVFPGIRANGLHFIQSDRDIHRWRGQWKHYFDDQHQPYSTRLSRLAKKVMEQNDNAPIRRLERIYDRLYIDEFQDLAGNDLVIIEALMKSEIDVIMTGDVRQTVLRTSRSDRLHPNYRGVELVQWYRERAHEGLCTLVEVNVTKRFNQIIADFTDLIHDPSLMLPRTTSHQPAAEDHSGVYLVGEPDIEAYIASCNSLPTILQFRRGGRKFPEMELLTFGSAKGLTREHVVISTTKPMRDWLTTRRLLARDSAAGFYVAATRARHSIALIVPNATKVFDALHGDFSGLVQLWSST